MNPDVDKFMTNFRWITPLVVSVVGILVTILLFVVNNLVTETRNVRLEVAETRKFAVQYTDKMVELTLKVNERKK